MINEGDFDVEEDMWAALAFDRQFLCDRKYEYASLVEKRSIDDDLARYWCGDAPDIATIDVNYIRCDAKEVELRTYIPAADSGSSFIVWIHGGGWQSGSLDGYDRLTRLLSNSAKCPVVAIGYTKAPEAVYPMQLRELYDGILYASEVLFPTRVRRGIAGYSAGANLVLSTLCSYQIDLGQGFFSKASLVSGVYDCDFNTPSYNKYDGMFDRSKNYMRNLLEVYAPGSILHKDQAVYPVAVDQNTCEDFQIIYAEHDLLRDDSVKLSKNLRRQGKAVSEKQVRNVTHIFLQRSMRVHAAEQTILSMGDYFLHMET